MFLGALTNNKKSNLKEANEKCIYCSKFKDLTKKTIHSKPQIPSI